jgi:hypothetical protein
VPAPLPHFSFSTIIVNATTAAAKPALPLQGKELVAPSQRPTKAKSAKIAASHDQQPSGQAHSLPFSLKS